MLEGNARRRQRMILGLLQLLGRLLQELLPVLDEADREVHHDNTMFMQTHLVAGPGFLAPTDPASFTTSFGAHIEAFNNALQREPTRSARRAELMLQLLRQRYEAAEFPEFRHPLILQLEAVLVAHGDPSCKPENNDEEDRLFFRAWWNLLVRYLAILDEKLREPERPLETLPREDYENLETWRKEAEEYERQQRQRQRSQQEKDEQDRVEGLRLLQAHSAQAWDDWAMHDELQQRGQPSKKVRVRVSMSSSSSSSTATLHLPVPSEGAFDISLRVELPEREAALESAMPATPDTVIVPPVMLDAAAASAARAENPHMPPEPEPEEDAHALMQSSAYTPGRRHRELRDLFQGMDPNLRAVLCHRLRPVILRRMSLSHDRTLGLSSFLRFLESFSCSAAAGSAPEPDWTEGIYNYIVAQIQDGALDPVVDVTHTAALAAASSADALHQRRRLRCHPREHALPRLVNPVNNYARPWRQSSTI